MTKMILGIMVALGLTAQAQSAMACPLIGRLVDVNCDQELRLAATGDSITFGVGDKNLEEDNGGWVLDISQLLPDTHVANLGIPGATSLSLYRAFRRNAYRGRETTQKLKDLDVLTIEVGTNNFWSYRATPQSVIRDIKRLQKFLSDFYTSSNQVPPLFVVATLPPTKRGFQQPFIDTVNKLLLLPSNVSKLNVQIRFDDLGSSIISADNLHPNSRGYRKMAKVVQRNLLSSIKEQALQSVGRDSDSDGVYDKFETIKFFTDPTNPDTDGDGFSDGQELFELATDPLVNNSSLQQ